MTAEAPKETTLANAPIVFDPDINSLREIVAATQSITATDFKNADQMALVTETRKKLVKARTTIQARGLEMRAESNAYNKRVSAKENELIAIIEPEELRLKQIEAEAKALALKEERAALLPERRARLTPYLDVAEVKEATDDMLNNMDTIQFEAWFNQGVAKHHENIRLAEQRKREEEQALIAAQQEKVRKEQEVEAAKLAAERKAVEDAQRKIDEDKRLEVARKEAIAQAEEKAKLDAERTERDRLAAIAKAEAERKAEEERTLKRKEFIKWRASLGWTEETKDQFKLEETADGYILLKIIGAFNK